MLLPMLLTTLLVSSAQTVVVRDIPQSKGKLMLCVWSSGTGFPDCSKGKPLRRMEVMPRSSSETIVIPDLPPGRYAISVALDRNGNGKIDKNLLGIPSEPIGVTGGRPRVGPPSFKASLFESSSGAVTVSLR